MKTLTKVLAVLIVLVMALSLVPVLEAPASAANTPILVLSSSTAVNPILDHVLSINDFGSGGTHTVTFEWRAVGIKSNDASDPNAAHAFVNITGTKYGSTTVENEYTVNPEGGIKGTTDWQKVTVTFGDVGVYGVSGTNIPGNILRFGMWKAKGELQIKNLQIKTGSTVKYDLNTDPTIAQAVTNTINMGMEECALDELAAINYENCPWVAGQFSTGAYAGYLRFESSSEPTSSSSSLTRPTQSSSTSSNTTKPTSAPTSKPTSAPTSAPTTRPTSAPTTKPTTKPSTVTAPAGHNCNTQGHSYVNGACKYCGATDPNYDPCAKGHDFVDGYCAICLTPDPNYNPCANGHEFVDGFCAVCLTPDPSYQPPTQPTTGPVMQNPTNNTPTASAPADDVIEDDTDNDGGFNPIFLVILVMVFAVGICVVVLYATGVFSKKK